MERSPARSRTTSCSTSPVATTRAPLPEQAPSPWPSSSSPASSACNDAPRAEPKPYRRGTLGNAVAEPPPPRPAGTSRQRVADLWVVLALLLVLPAGATLSHLWQAGPAPGFSLVSTGYEQGVQGSPQAFNL